MVRKVNAKSKKSQNSGHGDGGPAALEYGAQSERVRRGRVNADQQLHNVSQEILRLVDGSRLGRLRERANPDQFQGVHREIVQGVNDMLDAVMKPLNLLAGYVDRISKGDIPSRITEDFQGDFNSVKDSLNGCIDNFQALTTDTRMLNEAATAQEFDTRADPARHVGNFRQIVEGVNRTLDVLTEKLGWYQSVIDAVPFPIHVIDTNMNWVFLNKAFEKLMVDQRYIRDRSDAVGRPCSTANANICRTEKCGIAQLKRGVPESFFDWCGMNCKQDTSNLITIKGQNVGFVEVVQDLSATISVKDHTTSEVDRLASDLVQLARGDLGFELKTREAGKYTAEVKQQFDRINDSLRQLKGAISAMVSDVGQMAKAAVEGKLATRAEASRHQGDYRKIIEGFNQTLDAVIGPLNVTANYVDRISKGDMPPQITDTYNGEFNTINSIFYFCGIAMDWR
jgi:methyl-accepting chemotaxis protein